MKRIAAHTIRELSADGVSKLARAGVPSPRRNVEWLLCEVLGVGRAGLYARLDERADPAAADHFIAMLERRCRHEPLQHILGYTEFYGMRLDVSPDVLIPRPETEQVVEAALRLLADAAAPRVLDVGTGSGCIALAVRRERPDADVWASDVSKAALTVAAANAARHGLDLRLLEGDVFTPEFLERAPGRLDLLISNPPYVPEREAPALPVEVRRFEPRLALVAPSDPLVFYERLAVIGLELLRGGGSIVLETHADYGEEAADVLRRAGYDDVVLERDYADRPRILRAVRP